MVVTIRTTPTLRPGAPRPLFSTSFDLGGVVASYSISPDRRRFVAVDGTDTRASVPQMVVIPGWLDELRAKLR